MLVILKKSSVICRAATPAVLSESRGRPNRQQMCSADRHPSHQLMLLWWSVHTSRITGRKQKPNPVCSAADACFSVWHRAADWGDARAQALLKHRQTIMMQPHCSLQASSEKHFSLDLLFKVLVWGKACFCCFNVWWRTAMKKMKLIIPFLSVSSFKSLWIQQKDRICNVENTLDRLQALLHSDKSTFRRLDPKRY